MTTLSRRVMALIVVVMLATASAAPQGMAQTPQAAPADRPIYGLSEEEAQELRRARNDIALFYYGSRYALYVAVGVAAGGYLFALLSWGRTGSTIFGSVLGSMAGIWWFLDEFSGDFLERNPW